MLRMHRLSMIGVLALPLALMLWPLVRWNYYQRELGVLPDQWYWADAVLYRLGYYVKI